MSVITCPIQDFGQLYTAATARSSPPRTDLRDVWFSSKEGISGTLTINQPRGYQPAIALDGFYQEAVNSFLYGKLYVYPAIVNLGNLVSSEVRTFQIWNATFSTANVASVVAEDDDGLTLTQPFAAPYTLQPLQEAQYIIGVSTDGPAQLNASYKITVDSVDYTVAVRGIRTVLWPFKPNWADSVDETLEWLTDVITDFSGNEQRIRLRAEPRRGFGYGFHVVRTDTQHWDSILLGWQNRNFALPMWPYVARTTASVLAGVDTVPCNAIDGGFVAGEQCCLYESVQKYEVLTVESLTDTSITFTNPLAYNWPSHSKVMPVASSASLDGNVQVTHLTDSAITGSVDFRCSPGTTDPYLPVAAADVTYNGLEVLLDRPDWVSGIQQNNIFERNEIDNDVGDVAYATTKKYPDTTRDFRWVLTSRAKIRKFREFLARRAGQQRAFYVPSWNSTLSLSADIVDSSDTIYITDRDFFALVGAQNAVRGHIMIQLVDGTYFFRPINALGKTGTVMNVNIVTPLGQNVPRSMVRKVMYLESFRLAADRVTLNWQAENKVTVNSTFKLVAA